MASAALTLVLTACQGTAEPTATPVKFEPTPAPAGATTPAPARAPAATSASAPTAAPAAGNAQNGKDLFAKNGCSACHLTSAATLVGPGLAGVGDRAGSRVPGLSPDAYIEQSIRDPEKFIVSGFQNLMPATFKDLPAADVADLIAYLKTLK
jgi:cytochrome c oxidase subunit 2